MAKSKKDITFEEIEVSLKTPKRTSETFPPEVMEKAIRAYDPAHPQHILCTDKNDKWWFVDMENIAAQIKRQMTKPGYDSSQPVVVFRGCLNGEA